MTEKYTEKQKKSFLIKQGWEESIGYLFPNPTDSDYETHFVEKKEADDIIKKGEQSYYWSEGRESMLDLEEAWEYELDNFADSMEDYTEELFEKRLKESITIQ